MFDDDIDPEIKQVMREEKSRGTGRLNPAELARWKEFAAELQRAIDAKDARAFWQVANRYGIRPGSRYYPRLLKLSNDVF